MLLIFVIGVAGAPKFVFKCACKVVRRIRPLASPLVTITTVVLTDVIAQLNINKIIAL